MAKVGATIIDAADIRAYKCLLPDDVPVSRLALCLAERIHLPVIGPDDRPISYYFIIKGGKPLDPDASLQDLKLPDPLTLRLVPEVSAAADKMQVPPESIDTADEIEQDDLDIIISDPIALLHDTEFIRRPDVRIDANVHRDIEQFSREWGQAECAGLLLGTVDNENRERIIHIRAIAPARNAESTNTSVKLTANAWESMLIYRDRNFADLRILGWFHTHSGWGVFLSDSDVFIHRHFFPHPNMVAYVLDPTTGRDGFYYWHEGKIGLCPSYGLVGTQEEVDNAVDSRKNGKSLRRKFIYSVASLLLVGLIGLGLYGLTSSRPHHHRTITHKNPVPAVVNINKKTPEKQSVKVKTVKTVKAKVQEKVYVIGPNDNPWSICNRIYNDGELGPVLMRYNGMKMTGLQIGHELKLPPKETLEKLSH